MFGLLALAVTWVYCVGEWRAELTPLKIKKHGRRAKSIFRLGLDFLRRLLISNEPATPAQMIDFKHAISLLSCT